MYCFSTKYGQGSRGYNRFYIAIQAVTLSFKLKAQEAKVFSNYILIEKRNSDFLSNNYQQVTTIPFDPHCTPCQLQRLHLRVVCGSQVAYA